VQQNGLRAVFTHSFALLPPSQQVALSRLAIFRGGFSREAAVEVTQISFRDLLGLADASSLRFDGGRWFIHELIRQYASEILQTDSLEWNLVAGRYAAFYVELVFRTAPHLLLEEADNFRAVLTWSLSGDEAKQALQLATGLRGFWFGRGFIQEAITWLEAGLGLYDQTDELAIQARLVLAECLQTQGLSETSLRHLEVAISAARELLRTDLESLCQTMFARIYHRQSQYELAIRHCQWALELARPDSPSQAAALRWLGRAGIYIGDPKDALKLYRRFNDHEAVAHCLNSLALIAIERQDFMTARACFKEALGLHRQYQEKHGQALNLTGMGWLEMLSGDLSSARELTLQSLEIHLELGQQWDVLNAELNLGHIAYRTKNLVLAKDYYSKVLAQAGQIEAVSLQLEAMVGMAYVWESMPVLAAQLLGMALGHGQCNNEIISFAKDLNTQLKAVLAADFESVCQQGLERGLEATLIWMFSVFNSEKTIELLGGFHSRTLASKQ
jgi:tetratricopeptide (TPR) repeat protein